jgi:YD repeat-containing protein
MIRRCLLLGLICSCFNQAAICQTGRTFRPHSNDVVGPTAPQAYQFQKLGDIEVDIKTGTPKIQVPIHAIQLKNITWNIGLRYNARGFKASEVATSAGLGWTLEGSGIISTQVYGPQDMEMPYDEDSMVVRRFLDLDAVTSDGYSCAYSNQQDIGRAETALSYNGLLRNYLPDIYNLSLPGLSLKFFIHNDIGYTVPASDIKIRLQRFYANGDLEKAIITVQDEKGNKYFFSTKGYNRSKTLCNFGRSGLSGSESHIFYIDSTTSLKGDFLKFTYNEETYEYDQTPSITYNENIDNPGVGCSSFTPEQYAQTCNTTFVAKEASLHQIVSSNGENILFKYSPRQDLIGASKLDSVIIGQHGDIKKICFYNSYSGTAANNNLRLRLDSLATVNIQNNQPGEKYIFQYNATTLPPVNSLAIDHSGYYNGPGNGGTNPKFFIREPKLNYSKANILERIIYPTNGVTDFEYELNDNFGGLRIKSIEDRNSFSAKPIRKEYQYFTSSNAWIPPFKEYISTRYIYQDGVVEGYAECTYIRYYTHAVKDNPYTGGNYSYKKVVEYLGDHGEFGKNEYEFGRPYNYSYNVFSAEPQLIKKTTFKKLSDNSFRKIRQEEYQFGSGATGGLDMFDRPDNPKEKRLWGVIFMKLKDQEYQQLHNISKCHPKKFGQLHIAFCSFPEFLTKKTIKEFAYNNSIADSIVQEELYAYKSQFHNKPTSITTIDSRRDSVVKTFLYCTDYLTGTPFLDSLKQNNVLDNPVETIYSLTGNSGPKYVLASNLTEYNNEAVPVKSFFFGVTDPIAANTFKFSNTLAGQLPYESAIQSYQPDARFMLEGEITRLEKGNIIEARKQGNNYSSYIWDNYNRLTGKASNARHTDIAYTSFENDSKGSFTYTKMPVADLTTPTGNFVYPLLAGSITKSGLNPALSYIVSYWSKDQNGGVQHVNGTAGIAGASLNGWSYYEHTVASPASGIITVSGSGVIDELRLYPKGALMTTYVHRPLFGLASQCDENSMITHYEYDGFGKLRAIRDRERNIVKLYEYSFGNSNGAPNWQWTGQKRCKPCLVDHNFTAPVSEREEIDLNPESGSYNTYRWVLSGSDPACAVNNWVVTGTQCEMENGQINGFYLTTRRNINPCSPDYNKQQVTREINLTACPYQCNTSTCSGVDKKCVNGVCEKAVLRVTERRFDGRKWHCTFSYEWSDGTSVEAYSTITNDPC